MTESNQSPDIAAELTKLAAWIDDRMESETASRQYTAEQASERIKAIVAQLAAARRRPNLLGLELTVTQSLADALRYRRVAAAQGPKRSRRGDAGQAGMFLLAARTLGLEEALNGIVNVAEIRRELGLVP